MFCRRKSRASRTCDFSRIGWRETRAVRWGGRGGWGPCKVRPAASTCHDPHQPLVTETASYDSKCLSCHVTKRGEKLAEHPGAACPVGTSNCASCHMPKVEVPSMHAPFTDHRIRIVRDAAAYPN